MTTAVLAYFPSPPRGVWHLGPVPIRAYALFIIAGIVAALLIGDRRWEARGGERGVIYDIALWAVPFGLVGGRLYHLATDWRTYFGEGGAGLGAALRVWDGGLGIWGAVALGGVGAWIGCRRHGIPLPAFGDAIAPGIVLAQAIGRLGNYFNQELYGRETTLPWGLEIFYRRDPAGFVDVHSLDGASTGELAMVVQPTFLYELLWNLLVFVVLLYVDRRFRIGHGRLFALYVAGYCLGRFCIELLRDDVATHIAGIRINSFTSTFVFIGAVVYLILAPKGREDRATISGAPAKKPEPEPSAELVTVAAAAAAGADEPTASAPAATEAARAVEPEEAETMAGPVPDVETEAVATVAEEPEPEVEEPEVSGPEAEEAEVEEPGVSGPEAEEAEVEEAEVEEPEVSGPEAEEAEVEEAEVEEPEVSGPEVEEAEVEEPEVSGPEAEEAEAEEPEAEEPEVTEPEVEEAKAEEPEGESVETEAVATAAGEPEPEAEEPEVQESEVQESEVQESEIAEPAEPAEPEAEEPEAEVEDVESVDVADEADEEAPAAGHDEVLAEAEEAKADEPVADVGAQEHLAQAAEPTSPGAGRWRSRLSRLRRRSGQ